MRNYTDCIIYDFVPFYLFFIGSFILFFFYNLFSALRVFLAVVWFTIQCSLQYAYSRSLFAESPRAKLWACIIKTSHISKSCWIDSKQFLHNWRMYNEALDTWSNVEDRWCEIQFHSPPIFFKMFSLFFLIFLRKDSTFRHMVWKNCGTISLLDKMQLNTAQHYMTQHDNRKLSKTTQHGRTQTAQKNILKDKETNTDTWHYITSHRNTTLRNTWKLNTTQHFL